MNGQSHLSKGGHTIEIVPKIFPHTLPSSSVSQSMRQSLLTITVVISVLVVGCADNRVYQCNQLTEVINKADAATEGAKTGQPADLVAAANQLDQIAQELKAIEVKDKQLQSLRASFLLMYGEINQLFRNTAIAIRKKDRQGLQSYLKLLKEANIQDQVLVTKINNYCNGK